MNTPAHVVANLLCLGRHDRAAIITPVVVGAILPDAPMFVFYIVEKLVRGQPESVIWRQSYYQPHWQNLIDGFNSLPLMAMGLAVALWLGSQPIALLMGSMMLHVAGDLPLHHDDAHRHFFPFSNWRFESPISYWDPDHYGHWVTRLEILMVLVSCAVLFRLYRSRLGRWSIGAIALIYALFFLYVALVWD